MTDVLIDGRVIPVPPGWTIRLTLERVADDQHPVTRRGGNTAFGRLDAVKDPGDGGRRPPGRENDPGIDELEPLPLLRPRNGERRGSAPDKRKTERRTGTHGKLCPGCNRRVGPSTRVCGHCNYQFPVKVKS